MVIAFCLFVFFSFHILFSVGMFHFTHLDATTALSVFSTNTLVCYILFALRSAFTKLVVVLETIFFLLFMFLKLCMHSPLIFFFEKSPKCKILCFKIRF